RISDLLDSPNTAWRVSEEDRWQNRNYDDCLAAFDDYMEKTNPDYASWHIIIAETGKAADLAFFQTVIAGVEQALAQQDMPRPLTEKEFPLQEMPLLREVKLNTTVDDDVYKEELKAAQQKLKKLHNAIYRKKIPVIVAYEGWDAAGKGGNLKRLAQ